MALVLARVPRSQLALDPLIAEAKRRARRRRWLGVCVLVAALAAVAAALTLRSGSGSGLAAVGGRPVIHIVTETPPRTVYVDLKTGRVTSASFRSESWSDRRSGRNHGMLTDGGRVVADQLWTAHFRANSEAAAVTNLYDTLATGLRAALMAGKAELVGHGRFDGRHILWLQVRQTTLPSWRHGQPWPQATEAVGVDPRTYRPILLRFASGKHYSYTRVLAADTIPYNPADYRRRGPEHAQVGPKRLASGFAFGSPGNFGPGTAVVRAPWLTAGTTVAGLRLRAVVPFTIRKSKHHFRYGARNPKPIQGLELVYGPAAQRTAAGLPSRINLYGPQWEARATTHLTTVYEVPEAPRVPPWSTVPAGSIQLQSGLTTIGDRVVPTLRIGYLAKRGLYITIRTPEGRRTALRIARSLHAGS
jgi:hypothetical protein